MPRIALVVLVFALAVFPLAGLWEESGCILDPGGRCVPVPSQDEGCILEPGGGACRDRQ